MTISSIEQLIAHELNIPLSQVAATVGLLDDGNTIPFIARYRKEVTGGLDEVQIGDIQVRLGESQAIGLTCLPGGTRLQ